MTAEKFNRRTIEIRRNFFESLQKQKENFKLFLSTLKTIAEFFIEFLKLELLHTFF